MRNIVLTFLLINASGYGLTQAEDVPLPVRGTHYIHEFEIDEDYDKFRDRHSLSVSFPRLGTTKVPRRCVVVMEAFYLWEKDQAADWLGVVIGVASQKWINLEHFSSSQSSENESIFLLGGKRVIKNFEFDGTVENGVIETAVFKWGLEELDDLLRSDEVEIQLGQIDMKLSESQINALRDLASRIPRGQVGTFNVVDAEWSVMLKKAHEKGLEKQAKAQAAQQREMRLQQAVKEQEQADIARIEAEEKKERFALSKVRLAKKYLGLNKEAAAINLLREAVEKYPGTEGAKQAAELLKELE